jgi:predicted transcriptional regulator of viral defense system
MRASTKTHSLSAAPSRRRARPRGPKPSAFFASHPVFRLEEFRAFQTARGRAASSTAAILAYHVRRGSLRLLRRGLYVAPEPVDSYLLAARVTDDAVLAYEGALSLHGLTLPGEAIPYLTAHRASPLRLLGVALIPVRAGGHSVPDGAAALERAEIEQVECAGLPVLVTTRERSLVDVLDRHDLGPPLPMLVKLLLETRGLDVERMVRFARRTGNRVLCARLGCVLAARAGATGRFLRPLEDNLPITSAYFDPQDRQDTVPFSRWSLLVPRAIARTLG